MLNNNNNQPDHIWKATRFDTQNRRSVDQSSYLEGAAPNPVSLESTESVIEYTKYQDDVKGKLPLFQHCLIH